MKELRACRSVTYLMAIVAVVSCFEGCAKREPDPATQAETSDATNQHQIGTVAREPQNASKASQAGDVVNREGEPPIVFVDDGDVEMEAAIKTAQKTVQDFIRVLQSPGPKQSDFSVKLRISQGEHSEFMWIKPVKYHEEKFSGILNNEPNTVTTVKLGDRLESPANEIADWLYVEDGKLVGAYTLRVLRDRMSKEERKEFDKSLPFTIE